MAQVSALSSQFFEGQALHRQLSASSSASDPAYQALVKRALSIFLQLHYRVLSLSVFSKNEEVEDVSTADLKYALVPSFIGDLCQKVSWDSDRAAHIKASCVRLAA